MYAFNMYNVFLICSKEADNTFIINVRISEDWLVAGQLS